METCSLGEKRRFAVINGREEEDSDSSEPEEKKRKKSGGKQDRQFQFHGEGSNQDKSYKNFNRHKRQHDKKRNEKDKKKDKSSKDDKNRRDKKGKDGEKKPDMSNVVCFNCDKKGHFARDCKSKRKA